MVFMTLKYDDLKNIMAEANQQNDFREIISLIILRKVIGMKRGVSEYTIKNTIKALESWKFIKQHPRLSSQFLVVQFEKHQEEDRLPEEQKESEKPNQ